MTEEICKCGHKKIFHHCHRDIRIGLNEIELIDVCCKCDCMLYKPSHADSKSISISGADKSVGEHDASVRSNTLKVPHETFNQEKVSESTDSEHLSLSMGNFKVIYTALEIKQDVNMMFSKKFISYEHGLTKERVKETIESGFGLNAIQLRKHILKSLGLTEEEKKP